MKLHYSQTNMGGVVVPPQFQYLMKLHYSQTCVLYRMRRATFQYLMKLHYSQTVNQSISVFILVSVPYEITLLSNEILGVSFPSSVSVPYEITLLSN